MNARIGLVLLIAVAAASCVSAPPETESDKQAMRRLESSCVLAAKWHQRLARAPEAKKGKWAREAVRELGGHGNGKEIDALRYCRARFLLLGGHTREAVTALLELAASPFVGPEALMDLTEVDRARQGHDYYEGESTVELALGAVLPVSHNGDLSDAVKTQRTDINWHGLRSIPDIPLSGLTKALSNIADEFFAAGMYAESASAYQEAAYYVSCAEWGGSPLHQRPSCAWRTRGCTRTSFREGQACVAMPCCLPSPSHGPGVSLLPHGATLSGSPTSEH